jgi:eukaryotic-like serine/threonine-protein kinase
MATSPLIGQVLGHYRLLEQIGAGGMGIVYRARDLQLERDVAIKVLPAGTLSDEAARGRFRREALSLARLNHPNIATVFQFSSDNGIDFLVTEYIAGATLEDKLRSGPLPQTDVVSLGTQLAQGLACAHQEGVVHRDLKPANLRITPDGRLKVLDFGLAQLVEHRSDLAVTASVTQSQEVTGTLPYMAPEQLRGEKTDERSDIWSAGAVLYEMATGQRPFPEKQSARLIDAILNKPPQQPSALNARLSGGLARVILKALEKDPEQRYGSARELGADLDRLSIGVAPLAAGRRWSAVAAMVAAVLVVAAIVGGLVWHTQAHRLSEKDTVVVADFSNSTGEAIFDATLKKALAVDLGQSPYVNVFPEQRVRQTLQFMGKKPDERITTDVAREICQREGLKAMIGGSIASLGSQYVITLDATNAASGDTLAETQAQAERKEQVLEALGKATASLREKLGESLSSVQKYDMPLSQATTSSLEALKAFSLGDIKHFAGEDLEAVPLYRRAVELDPQFAIAHARLAAVYSNIGQQDQVELYGRKAYELRNRASERERLYIVGHYFTDDGEVDNGIEAHELYKQSYPRDSIPYNNLAAIYIRLGQFDKALQNAQQALRIDPTSATNYETTAFALMALNRLEEAKTVLNQAMAAKRASYASHFHLAEIALAQGDVTGMEREQRLAQARPQGQTLVLSMNARLALARGQLRQTDELMRQFSEGAQRLGLSQAPAEMRAYTAAFESFYGYPARARDDVRQALKISRTAPVLIGAAIALAVSGDPEQALKMAEEARARRPRDIGVTRLGVPVIKAWLAIKRSDAQEALRQLEPAKPYDDGDAGSLLTRGWAYNMAGQPEAAIQEYDKVLKMGAALPEDANLTVALLGRARAYASARDFRKSRLDYESLLAKWQHADPGVPLVQDAKAEWEKVRRQ